MASMKRGLVPCLCALVLSYMLFKTIEITSMPVAGWTEEGWEELREAFQGLVDTGLEKGGSFAVHYRGRLVAHLWGGCKNFFCTDVWRTDTTALMHSSTQLLGALCLAVMADRGRMNYSDPVAAYWPEFAAHGKTRLTVAQLLSHQGGLVGVEPSLTLDELREGGSLVGERLAEQKPAWPPGKEVHYHALTMGLYMDELFRRVDPKGRTCPTFLEREILKPLGLDIKVGLHDGSQMQRFAWPYSFSNLRLLLRPFLSEDKAPLRLFSAYFWRKNDTYRRTMSPFGRVLFAFSFPLPEVRSAALLGSNGVATADSLARLLGGLAYGDEEKFPRRLLASNATLKAISTRHANLTWMAAPHELYFGNGFAHIRAPDGSWLVGFPGTGGQMAFAAPERRLAWSYLTNHLSPYSMGDDPRSRVLLPVLYRLMARQEA